MINSEISDNTLSFNHATKILDAMLKANPGFLLSMEQLAEINSEKLEEVNHAIGRTADQFATLSVSEMTSNRGLQEIADDVNRTPEEDNLLKLAESCLEVSDFKNAKENNVSFAEISGKIRQSIDEKSMDISNQMKKDKEREEPAQDKFVDPRIMGVMESIMEQLQEYLDKPIIEYSKDQDKDQEKENGKEVVEEKSKEEPLIEKEIKEPEQDKMAAALSAFRNETKGYGLDTIEIVGSVSVEQAVESGSKEAVGSNIDKAAVAQTKSEQNSKAYSSSLPSKK